MTWPTSGGGDATEDIGYPTTWQGLYVRTAYTYGLGAREFRALFGNLHVHPWSIERVRTAVRDHVTRTWAFPRGTSPFKRDYGASTSHGQHITWAAVNSRLGTGYRGNTPTSLDAVVTQEFPWSVELVQAAIRMAGLRPGEEIPYTTQVDLPSGERLTWAHIDCRLQLEFLHGRPIADRRAAVRPPQSLHEWVDETHGVRNTPVTSRRDAAQVLGVSTVEMERKRYQTRKYLPERITEVVWWENPDACRRWWAELTGTSSRTLAGIRPRKYTRHRSGYPRVSREGNGIIRVSWLAAPGRVASFKTTLDHAVQDCERTYAALQTGSTPTPSGGE